MEDQREDIQDLHKTIHTLNYKFTNNSVNLKNSRTFTLNRNFQGTPDNPLKKNPESLFTKRNTYPPQSFETYKPALQFLSEAKSRHSKLAQEESKVQEKCSYICSTIPESNQQPERYFNDYNMISVPNSNIEDYSLPSYSKLTATSSAFNFDEWSKSKMSSTSKSSYTLDDVKKLVTRSLFSYKTSYPTNFDVDVGHLDAQHNTHTSNFGIDVGRLDDLHKRSTFGVDVGRLDGPHKTSNFDTDVGRLDDPHKTNFDIDVGRLDNSNKTSNFDIDVGRLEDPHVTSNVMNGKFRNVLKPHETYSELKYANSSSNGAKPNVTKADNLGGENIPPKIGDSESFSLHKNFSKYKEQEKQIGLNPTQKDFLVGNVDSLQNFQQGIQTFETSKDITAPLFKEQEKGLETQVLGDKDQVNPPASQIESLHPVLDHLASQELHTEALNKSKAPNIESASVVFVNLDDAWKRRTSSSSLFSNQEKTTHDEINITDKGATFSDSIAASLYKTDLNTKLDGADGLILKKVDKVTIESKEQPTFQSTGGIKLMPQKNYTTYSKIIPEKESKLESQLQNSGLNVDITSNVSQDAQLTVEEQNNSSENLNKTGKFRQEAQLNVEEQKNSSENLYKTDKFRQHGQLNDEEQKNCSVNLDKTDKIRQDAELNVERHDNSGFNVDKTATISPDACLNVEVQNNSSLNVEKQSNTKLSEKIGSGDSVSELSEIHLSCGSETEQQKDDSDAW